MHKVVRKLRLSLLFTGLFIVTLVLSVGTTQAHYEAVNVNELNMRYRDRSGRIYLRSAKTDENGAVIVGEDGILNLLETWQPKVDENGLVKEDTWQLDFLLTNGTTLKEYCTYDQKATLFLVATEGLKDPNNLVITLTDGNLEYTAKAEAIGKDSVQQRVYGPGWIYRFYNTAGQELNWDYEGGQLICRKLSLTVVNTMGTAADDAALPGMLRLMAAARSESTDVTDADSWMISLPEVEKEEMVISSELLSETDRTIILNAATELRTIPIHLLCQGLAEEETLNVTVSAVSSNENWLKVSVDSTNFTMGNEEKQISMSLQVLPAGEEETSAEESSTIESSTAESSTEESSTAESVSEQCSSAQMSSESESASEQATSVQDSSDSNESNTNESISSESSGENNISQEAESSETASEQEEGSVVSEPAASLEDLVATVDQTETDTQDTVPIEEYRTGDVSVAVTVTCGEKVLKATFLIPMENPENPSAVGALTSWPSQYHIAQPMRVSVGTTACELLYNEGHFPAGTEYSCDGRSTLLYDGGVISLPADTDAYIDLSRTELTGDLIFQDRNSNTYNIVYAEYPTLSEDLFPRMLGTEILETEIPWLWGTQEPQFVIERLAVNEENEQVWEPVATITAQKTETGYVALEAKNALAGTYQLIVSWLDNEITLYQMEVPFFVQYESVGQGGTGQ